MPVERLTFNPLLRSIIPVQVDEPSACIMGARLRWRATLGWEDYDALRHAGGQVQVWSKCTGGDWSATTFQKCPTVKAFDKDAESIDLSLIDSNAETTENQVSLEASLPLPSLVGGSVSVEFTYRVEYTSDGCIRWDWAGTHNTNGEIVVSNTQNDDFWVDGEYGTFLWTRKPMEIAKLSSDAKWSGWAYKEEIATGLMVFQRFTGVASESLKGPITSLALLPEENPDASVLYSPVLYTVKNGALVLEGDHVVLHPENGELALNACTSAPTWKDHIPYKPGFLDIQTSDFLAVSHNSQVNIGHLQFLPVTGAQSIVTLTLSDIASLIPASSVVLFDSTLRAIKFLPAFSTPEHLRIAVGPMGGEILIVPAYPLSPTMSVAFLHDSGSIATLQGNVENPPPKCHPPKGVFSLAVRVFQHILDLLLSSMSARLSNVSVREDVVSAPQDHSTATSPRLAFKVKGRSPLLVKGEDISKLQILVSGEPLQIASQDVGGGHWLIETASGSDIAYPERRVEISLRE